MRDITLISDMFDLYAKLQFYLESIKVQYRKNNPIMECCVFCLEYYQKSLIFYNNCKMELIMTPICKYLNNTKYVIPDGFINFTNEYRYIIQESNDSEREFC